MNSKRRRWAVVVLLAAITVASYAAAKPPAKRVVKPVPRENAASPDSVAAREVVRYLADPAREGRGVGTAGIDSAAAYLAAEMRRLGLVPAGDSASYLQ